MESYEKRTWWTRYELTNRLKAPAFLEAAVTTAFLVAAADGTVSEAEQDALLDRLEILGGVDRDAIDEQLTAVAQKLEAGGFEPLIARVNELTGEGDGEAVLMLGLAIALADDDFSKEEREVTGQLAIALELKVDLDTLAAEIRG